MSTEGATSTGITKPPRLSIQFEAAERALIREFQEADARPDMADSTRALVLMGYAAWVASGKPRKGPPKGAE